MAWSVPPAFAAGMTAGLAAALQKLSDDLALIGGVRPSWVPTWTQVTTNPTLGNGTVVGDYRQVDKEIDFLIQLTIGSSTVVGTGAFLFALPTPARRGGSVFLGGVIDASASLTQSIPIAGEIVAGSLGVLQMRTWPTTAGNGFQILNQTQPITPAIGDVFTVSGRYEAA